MATAFLQLNPDNRISADEALRHRYFASLPKKLYELPDGKSQGMTRMPTWLTFISNFLPCLLPFF